MPSLDDAPATRPDVQQHAAAAALMARAARGERAAWHELYRGYKDYVFRTAVRYLGDEAAAADVTQDVFVALFQRAGQYHPGARFTTFLFRVVANRCLNERARAHSRRRDPGGSDSRALAQVEAAEGSRPDVELAAREDRERVRAAILALPERQRLAVILSRYEGLGYEAIAEAMDTSVSTVESLLFRARRGLADTLR
jgi:RNA polymerase sigma-70 factor (ECF subfamily)